VGRSRGPAHLREDRREPPLADLPEARRHPPRAAQRRDRRGGHAREL